MMSHLANTTQQAESVCAKPIDQIDHIELQDAMADLSVALTFLEASDNFIDEVRQALAPSGWHENRVLFKETLNAQVMLSELRERLGDVDRKIDSAVGQIFAMSRA